MAERTSATEPMASLGAGTRARIVEIKLMGTAKSRLMEMGLLVGTQVEIVRFAPLGDPVELKVRGYHLSLRKHEAEQILVRRDP